MTISTAVARTDAWTPARLKFAAPLRNERMSASSDHAAYLGLENIESWTGRIIEGESKSNDTTDDDTGLANVFKEGDVLFGKLRPYLAKACHAPRDGVCSTELLVMRPAESLHPKFLLYSLLTPDFVGAVDASTFGAKMPRASWDFIGSLEIRVPPIEAQAIIANYLDRETARIDGLIAEKERMLALLDEKRAALISRVVTRGLDPNAPLKPSGQEWLGEIPAHWEVRTLKRASSKIDTGTTPAASFMDGSLTSDFTWFTPSDFQHGGVIEESNRKIPQEAVDEGEAKVFPAHSLMVIGIGATLGKVASSRARFSANQQINVITPLESVRWDYLLYVLQGYEHVFRAHANSATLPILNQERLGVIRVPVPPWAEQDAIVTRLNESREECAEVNQLLGNSISLLKERRAALISAAVTGQIPLEEMTG